jgi:hypothetical protein
VAAAAVEPYARRVVRILRGRASSIAVFVVIFVLFEFLRAWTIAIDPITAAYIIPLWPMIGAAIVVPVLVEATGLHGITLAGGVAVTTIAAVGMVVLAIAQWYPGPVASGVSIGLVLSNEAFLYRGWWLYSAAGLLFAAYCRFREREQAAMRAARTAELERADTQREIVASRLKVLQARVEPTLLFDALADVRAAYLWNPQAADALLDDLVAYLRAALPHMRGGASTVGREVALAEAYLRVVPAGRNRKLVAESDVADDISDVDFPPMVVLPLVHAAADAGCGHVSIEARRHARVAEIAVRASDGAVPPGWNEDALEIVRETLVHYLGSDASLAVSPGHTSAAAVVTWPPGGASGVAVQRVA